MIPMKIGVRRGRPLEVLCVGAHCDDIEIGCGATLLRLCGEQRVRVTWMVLTSTPARATEARRSAALFLQNAEERRLIIAEMRDGYLPSQWSEAKDAFEALKRECDPDVIFTHDRADRHQDHRVVSELTWNSFRDHLILEYEVPKYDGELSPPSVYFHVSRELAARKASLLFRVYRSQRQKSWFTRETLVALMRLRGVECGSPSGLAEAFVGRKILV